MEKRPARPRAAVVLAVLLVVLLGAAASGFGYLVWQQRQIDRAVAEVAQTPLPAVEPTVEAQEAEPQNPIDFAALQAENPDLYAWIYVPNTNVNLPVAQRAGDDFFYLDHDYRGNCAVEGAVFSQMANAKDFTDPVTVLYGHNIVNDGMFATLHSFEDPAFFAANEAFYVYIPRHILTYRVVAAYEYDDRHILNSFDFTDSVVRENYFASVLAPDDLQANVREGIALNAESKLVQLSTCRSAFTSDPVRYLVTGVLVDDQTTAAA